MVGRGMDKGQGNGWSGSWQSGNNAFHFISVKWLVGENVCRGILHRGIHTAPIGTAYYILCLVHPL